MKQLTKYEELIDEHKDVKFVDYQFKSNRIKGLYCNGVVATSNQLSTNEKNGTIAEELGHYHTSSGDIIDMNSVSNRKQELKARAWAYDKLINLQGLINAFEHNCTNLYETAEFLDVTEEFLIEAIQLYQTKYGQYAYVDNYTIFFNYPNIGIIKKL